MASVQTLRSLSFLLLLSIALALPSCVKEPASSVDQDKIFAEYELFYDANTDKTYARATFRFSNITGTKLELDGSGSVKFNNDALTLNELLGYYEKEYAGLLPSGTFTFTDLDGKIFINTAEIHAIDLPASVDSIARSAAFDLPWTGSALAPLEIVTASLNNANAINPQLFVQDDVSSQSVVLAQNQLNTLFAGVATLAIERRYLPVPTQVTSAGGLVVGRYRAKEKQVVLYN